MKQTMKRQWADWWKCGRMPKDPTWGWNFHFTVFLLFLFFFFHFSAAPFYAGPYIVAVLVATLSVFCLQFSVCQYFLFLFFFFFVFCFCLSMNWVGHTLLTHCNTTDRPFPPLVASHESTFIKCKPFHSLLCKFSFIFLQLLQFAI